MRIHQVKRGPFHEHSSQLYAIATGVATWRKVNSGLFKMYEVRHTHKTSVTGSESQWIFCYHQAEVLGKRVVVQHLPLGGLLEWNVIGAPPIVTSFPRSHVCTATPVPWGSSRASISEGRSAEPSMS